MFRTTAPLALFTCCTAQGLIAFSLYEGEYNSKAGVMLEFSGSANITALTACNIFTGQPFLNPGSAVVRSSTGSYMGYNGLSGPPVPEPSQYAVFGAVVVLAGACCLRRRRVAA